MAHRSDQNTGSCFKPPSQFAADILAAWPLSVTERRVPVAESSTRCTTFTIIQAATAVIMIPTSCYITTRKVYAIYSSSQPLDTLITHLLNQPECSITKVHFWLIKQVNLIDNYTIYKQKTVAFTLLNINHAWQRCSIYHQQNNFIDNHHINSTQHSP